MTINELIANGTFGQEAGIGFHMPRGFESQPWLGLFLDLNCVEKSEQDRPVTGWLLDDGGVEGCYAFAETLEEAFVIAKRRMLEDADAGEWLALSPSFY